MVEASEKALARIIRSLILAGGRMEHDGRATQRAAATQQLNEWVADAKRDGWERTK